MSAERVDQDSADTLADRIAETVGQWLADNGGGMTVAFTMALNYIDEDGEGCWSVVNADRQTPASTLGLLRWSTMYVEHDLSAYFDSISDD